MGRPIYSRGHCKVYPSFTPKGKKYYTVVNTKLRRPDGKSVHRHYEYEKQAIMICKRAGQCLIPKHYSNMAKKDILYLITGDDAVYKNGAVAKTK